MAKLTVVDEETGVERSTTPEELAAHIIAEANKTALVEISGIRRQELDKIVRYKHAKEIFSKGEGFYEKMQEPWRSEVVEKFVESTFKQQEKVIAKSESDAKLEYFQLLVARGTAKDVALEMSGL